MNTAALCVHMVLSFGLAGALPNGERHRQEQEFLGDFAASLHFAGPVLKSFLRGEWVNGRWSLAAAAYALPQLVSGIVFVSLLWLLARHRGSLSKSTPKAMTGWAWAFCAVSIPAMPVIAQDFWLSAGWGRMVAAGLNPYHIALTPTIAEGLPLDMYQHKMTYGPLWAVVSGVVMAAAGKNALWAGALFKLLLSGAWLGCLMVTRRLLEEHGPWRQCIGIAIVGWLPVSVHTSIAEGHNDIAMLLFVLLWLHELKRGQPMRASLYLAASVLIKYVAAPLFLLHMLHERLARRRSWLSSAGALIPAAAVMAAVTAMFFRSPQFILNAWEMTSWRFYDPQHAVAVLQRLTGFTFLPLAQLVRFLFLAIPAYFTIRYCLSPVTTALHQAAAAMLTGILCSVVGHIWPWFLTWPLCLAALTPASKLSRWVIGLSLAVTASFPASVTTFVAPGAKHRFDIPSILFHVAALVWLTAAPRQWFAGDSSGCEAMQMAAADGRQKS